MKSSKLISKYLAAALILFTTNTILPLPGFGESANIHVTPDVQTTTSLSQIGIAFNLDTNGELISDSLNTKKSIEESSPALSSIDLFRAGTYLVMACKLNGKPAYFLIDTGASYSILDQKLAKGYDLTLLERKDLKLTGFGGNSGSIHIAIGAELNLDTKNVPHSFLVQDLSKLIRQIHSEFQVYITGIMGTDLLKRIGGTIDLGNRVLRFGH